MRILFVSSLALCLLAGCAVVPSEAWTFDATHPSRKTALSIGEAVALTNRIAELQLQLNQIRDRIAAQPDIWARQDLYAQLHDVGMQLSALERRVAASAR
jgi:hypothetical protein